MGVDVVEDCAGGQIYLMSSGDEDIAAANGGRDVFGCDRGWSAREAAEFAAVQTAAGVGIPGLLKQGYELAEDFAGALAHG